MKSILTVIFLLFLALISETLKTYCIVGIVLICFWHFLHWIAKRDGDKIPNLHCYLFSGSMGSGKSYCSVESAVRIYLRRNFQYAIYRIFFWVEKIPCKYLRHIFPEEWKYPCEIYSTYPICVKWKKIKRKDRKERKRKFKEAICDLKMHLQNDSMTEAEQMEAKHAIKWLTHTMEREPILCKPLKVEHLLMEEKLPENSVLVIGEAGRILPQWDYSNPIVCEQIAHFVALSRQFANLTIILDDQCSDNVVKAVRCRLGMIYHLHNFHRLWGIFPDYKVYYTELLPVEDTTLTTKEVEGETFFTGYLPYPWTPFAKRYESRMYKELYYSKATETAEEYTTFYTRYMPNIAVDDAICKFYLTHKREYKQKYMYREGTRFDTASGKFTDTPTGGGSGGGV